MYMHIFKVKNKRSKTKPKDEGLIPTCKYSYILFFCGKKRVYTKNIFFEKKLQGNV